jgi:hypothetical protein
MHRNGIPIMDTVQARSPNVELPGIFPNMFTKTIFMNSTLVFNPVLQLGERDEKE